MKAEYLVRALQGPKLCPCALGGPPSVLGSCVSPTSGPVIPNVFLLEPVCMACKGSDLQGFWRGRRSASPRKCPTRRQPSSWCVQDFSVLACDS